MNILITGADGQLGRATTHFFQELAGANVSPLNRASLDISDELAVSQKIAQLNPDVVVNCAAYTAVDRAEEEQALAEQINVQGPRLLANALVPSKARLIHISTDFVFDGRSSSPYVEADNTAPLGIYGKTKLAGEQAVLHAHTAHTTVLRTSWVYHSEGNNFVRTMMKLFSQRTELPVVADQVGSPTSAATLANTIGLLVDRDIDPGIYHVSNSGVASWYDLAVAVEEEAAALGLLEHRVTIRPITTSDYPTMAKRPAYSVMNCHKIQRALDYDLSHWRVALRQTLNNMESA